MTSLSRSEPTIDVYVNGQLTTSMVVHTIESFTGGKRMDSAILESRGGGSSKNTYFQDSTLSSYVLNQEIQIAIDGQVVHWGKVVGTVNGIAPEGESLLYLSRLDPHLFGNPLDRSEYGSRPLNVPSTAGWSAYLLSVTDLPTIFNPVIDGVAYPNKLTQLNGGAIYHLLVDPESVDEKILETDRIASERASRPTGTNTVVEFWTLAEAVNYCCQVLNSSQTYIQNPSLPDLFTVLGADTSLLRDYELPLGIYLPDCLDLLLEPFGFSWRVRLDGDTRTIVVFEKGSGVQRYLRLQSFGENLDPDLTNLVRMNLTLDAADSSMNAATLLGAYIEREVTVDLRPGWKHEYQSTDGSTSELDQYNRSAEGWESDIDLQQAWRKYVANENGDYTGAAFGNLFGSALDLDSLFGFSNSTIRRRRRLYPTLTQNADGEPIGTLHGCFLEYRDFNSAGGLAEWKPVIGSGPDNQGLLNGQSVSLLTKEIGVWFGAMDVPPRLWEIAKQHGINKLKLRITGTIRADIRVRGNYSNVAASLLKDEKRAVLDVSKEFSYRQIDSASQFAGGVSTKVSDGRAACTRLASDLVNSFLPASMHGPVTIEGIDWNFVDALGTVIAGVNGRNINLTTRPSGYTPESYPLIVGVTLDVQKQKTTLHLDSYRPSIAAVKARKTRSLSRASIGALRK